MLTAVVAWASVLLVSTAGCGGSTSSLVAEDSGGPDGASSGSSTTPGGGDGGAQGGSFNPGALGSIVGGSLPDAGASAVADGGGISPPVVEGCSELCTKEQAARCPGSSTLSSCQVGCELVARNPACASAAQSLFTCANGATASCDSSGNPTFAGCGVQGIAVEACVLLTATDGSLASPRATYCAAVAAAKCPNDAPNGCQASCQILGNLFGCDPQWTQYVTCANGATLCCGSEGTASAPSCRAQAASVWECAAAALVTASATDGG
jgi:hypothetical protein